MTGPPAFDPQWTTPPPPRQPDSGRPLRPGRVFAGIGVAYLGHVLVAGLIILLIVQTEATGELWVYASVGAELLLFVGCLVGGIMLLVRGDRGWGLGLLIGWATGVIVLPVIGFGVCVAIFSAIGAAAPS